jgi:hypothetical protein
LWLLSLLLSSWLSCVVALLRHLCSAPTLIAFRLPWVNAIAIVVVSVAPFVASLAGHRSW